ncbi:hypothetical protein BJ322DRAFT_224644 [Thelephora terrestris]|uniref:Uncharacterized protein n=1 Tax=Thelephora terrestris TaxID=56493 RepID=A0A9P6H9T2_9AGAM|nr:hypothetical protein BJ322DRAFT_224644 [Thelephora terrestris]
MWSSPPLKRDSSKFLSRRSQNSPGPLLISVPLPTSSPCRVPKPPPSSPIRVRPSPMRRDSEDLIFAMSPDQNTFPHTSHRFHSLQSTKPAVATRYQTKHLVDRSTLKNPHPFHILLDSQTQPTEDEKPVLYPVPTIKKSPGEQSGSATPKSKRHALLKPFASATRLQSAPICSGSTTTSEDEDEFPPSPRIMLPSPILDQETRATVDILDDISTTSHSPPRTRSGFFGPGAIPTPVPPSIQNHRRGDERGSDVRMRIAESFGLDKFLSGLTSPGSVEVKQVVRGRPKHRKSS